MRILGGIIFLAGTVGYGIYQSSAYDNRTAMLRQAVEMMQYLISQIEIENASLPESICKVSVRMEGGIAEVLKNMTKCIRENDGKPLSEIWQEQIGILKEAFSVKDMELLLHMFDQTGFYDTKTQMQRLKVNLEAFMQEIGIREAERESKCRLYQSMGFMLGVFVMILLW